YCNFRCVDKFFVFFFFSSRRRHTRFSRDWSSDVCSSDLGGILEQSNTAVTFSIPPVKVQPRWFISPLTAACPVQQAAGWLLAYTAMARGARRAPLAPNRPPPKATIRDRAIAIKRLQVAVAATSTP